MGVVEDHNKEDIVESIQINKNSVDNRIKLSMATITELADSLVRDENIASRAIIP